MNESIENDFSVSFKGIEYVALLKSQLYCLENDLPVRGYNTSEFADKKYWKSYLTRQCFYNMEGYTENMDVYYRMKNALLVLKDPEVNDNCDTAISWVNSHIKARREKQHDEAITYNCIGVKESNAISLVGSFKSQILQPISYDSLIELGNSLIEALIEIESAGIDEYETDFEETYNGCIADCHTSGHHRDTLQILHGAYKGYSWEKASTCTLHEDDESNISHLISHLAK